MAQFSNHHHVKTKSLRTDWHRNCLLDFVTERVNVEEREQQKDTNQELYNLEYAQVFHILNMINCMKYTQLM